LSENVPAFVRTEEVEEEEEEEEEEDISVALSENDPDLVSDRSEKLHLDAASDTDRVAIVSGTRPTKSKRLRMQHAMKMRMAAISSKVFVQHLCKCRVPSSTVYGFVVLVSTQSDGSLWCDGSLRFYIFACKRLAELYCTRERCYSIGGYLDSRTVL
jgi:hypothetical protein